jgi:hypothetical protein
MSRSVAALSGAGFALLGVAGTLASPPDPDFVAKPAALAAHYTENHGALLGADSLYLLAGALLLVFAGYVRSAIARGAGRLAEIAFAGFVAGAAASIGAASVDLVAALRAEENGTIPPDVAAVMFDTSNALFGLAAPMAFAVAVLAVAVASFRTALLPVPFAVVSVVLGVALLVPPINYIAVIVFTFWCLAAGLMLYLRPVGAAVAEPSRPDAGAPAPAAA